VREYFERFSGQRITAEELRYLVGNKTDWVPGIADMLASGRMIEGADLVIYDSTYTDAEFPSKRGWGHSTWQEGVRLVKMAGARRLAIFHHDPDHEDHFMEDVEASALSAWPGCFVARDNMRINLI
jgi:ribonuclease BN (tRNA processing enzyme)